METLSLPTDLPFDYQLLMDRLEGRFRAPRNKIQSLCRSGEIIRVKKGLYVFGPDFARGPYSLEILANLIYGPSCISLQYALAYYGLIPERVTEVTCVTPKRDKLFDTPVGRFRYRYLRPSRYPVGVILHTIDTGRSFLIASAEKALADLLVLEYKRFRPDNTEELREFLFDNLRLEEEELQALDAGLCDEIASASGHPSVRLLCRAVRSEGD